MKIHLHSRPGLYTVATYGTNSITLHTKHKMFGVPITDFKCFAGGGWAEANDEEQKLFLSVVAPHLLEKTLETEAKIKALASLIDIQEKAKESAQAFVDQYSSRIIHQLDVEDDEDDDDDDDLYGSDYPKPTAKEYEEWWRKESDRHIETKNKLERIARKIYSNPVDMQQFQVPNGIKFIIQQNYKDKSYRFCWDPYGFVDNGHSAISSIYRHNEFHTINGGWIKIIEKDVILYYKSGDYGVYNDDVAIECAKTLFPGKKIHSFAGREWDKELDKMFMELPF